jgi:hypothetical protein
MAKDMKTGQYQDDRGRLFKLWIEVSRLSGAVDNDEAIGYAEAGADAVPFPRGSRPRAVQVKSAAGAVRWVTCFTPTCDLWTGESTAITISPFAGSGVTAVEFTRTGVVRGEKLRSKASDNYAG